jgi:tape measure domain-containing protein
MSIPLDELVVRLKPAGGQAVAASLGAIKTQVSGLGSMAMQATMGMARGVSMAMGAMARYGVAAGGVLTGAAVGFLAASMHKAAEFDSLKMSLGAISGSAESTRKQLERLREVAKLPGLGFEEAIRGSVRLQTAGFSASGAEKAIMAFGNALAMSGGGRQELEGTIYALGQIASKGQVSAEEINQLAERVFMIRPAMLAAFGTANTELIQRMGITAAEFIPAVVAQLNTLPKVAGGVKNSYENMADSINASMVTIGTSLNKAALPVIEKLAETLDRMGTNGELDAIAKGITSVVMPAFNGLMAALKDVQKVGFIPWLARIADGFFQLAQPLAWVYAGIMALTKNYPQAVMAGVAAAGMGLMRQKALEQMAYLQVEESKSWIANAQESASKKKAAEIAATKPNQVPEPMLKAMPDVTGNLGLGRVKDSVLAGIERNTRRSADALEELRVQLLGGGGRMGNAMSSTEAEIALARALGAGIG